jgi:hypothetical protein
VIHLALHLIIPALVAAAFYRAGWRRAFALMMCGMLIDIDHLLANPIYDPARCSIGFHPLHTLLPAALYSVFLASKTTRPLGIGLYLHLALDSLDCYVTNGVWITA